MTTMNDDRGCSVCPAGKENYETFTTRYRGRRVKRVMYDYRAEDGELFSTVAPNLPEARARRDEWLAKKNAASHEAPAEPERRYFR